MTPLPRVLWGVRVIERRQRRRFWIVEWFRRRFCGWSDDYTAYLRGQRPDPRD